MKKLLLSIVTMVTFIMMIHPTNAILPDNDTQSVYTYGDKKSTVSNDSDCSLLPEGDCNSVDPFAMNTKKNNDDKKSTVSNDSDCSLLPEGDCNSDLVSTSTSTSNVNSEKINPKGADIAKIVFVDYGRPARSFNNAPADDACGDGSGKYATLSGGIKWKSFPVTYTIDASSSGIDSTAAKNAVMAAFKTIDDEQHPAGDFFVQTNSNPKITVKWTPIDGRGSILAQTTTYFNTASKTIVKADIVFDSADKWSVNSNFGCNGGGDSFDVQNVGTHEIGHAIGLGHVSDNLLTMYRYASPGETLKSSLGRGDQRGIDKLY